MVQSKPMIVMLDLNGEYNQTPQMSLNTHVPKHVLCCAFNFYFYFEVEGVNQISLCIGI